VDRATANRMIRTRSSDVDTTRGCMNASWFDKASEHLEWRRLVQAVLARCRGASARERGLTHARNRDEAALLLREASEAMAMLERGERVPLDGLREIGPHLARIERQGALKASGLGDILSTLQAARLLRGFLAGQRAHAPALYEACSTDPALDGLEQQLRAALGPDGELSDNASPELKSLRTEVANLRERIIGRLRELIERYNEVLSDSTTRCVTGATYCRSGATRTSGCRASSTARVRAARACSSSRAPSSPTATA
jgi:dsDNA-specific endonuclease/ATPase MutS2